MHLRKSHDLRPMCGGTRGASWPPHPPPDACHAPLLLAACIAIAREVGDQMVARRPIDTKGATDFAVAMIQSGLHGLPRAQA